MHHISQRDSYVEPIEAGDRVMLVDNQGEQGFGYVEYVGENYFNVVDESGRKKKGVLRGAIYYAPEPKEFSRRIERVRASLQDAQLRQQLRLPSTIGTRFDNG